MNSNVRQARPLRDGIARTQRDDEVDVMELEEQIRAEEKATEDLIRDTTGTFIERRRKEIEQMHGKDKRAAIAELFLTLESKKHQPSSSSSSSSAAGPPQQEETWPEERALRKLRAAVPATGLVPWSWTAALVDDSGGAYANVRAQQDGNVRQLHATITQIHAGIRRLVAPHDTVHGAFWYAAARPPWPDVPGTGTRTALTIQGWYDLIRRGFALSDVGIAVLHRSSGTLRIAYVGDWLIESLNTVVAVVLDAATAEANQALNTEPGKMMHYQDINQEVRENGSVTWAYVGTTLADGKLVELVNVRKRRARGLEKTPSSTTDGSKKQTRRSKEKTQGEEEEEDSLHM